MMGLNFYQFFFLHTQNMEKFYMYVTHQPELRAVNSFNFIFFFFCFYINRKFIFIFIEMFFRYHISILQQVKVLNNVLYENYVYFFIYDIRQKKIQLNVCVWRNILFSKYKFIYIARCILYMYMNFNVLKKEWKMLYYILCIEIVWKTEFLSFILLVYMCNTINKALTLTDYKIVTKYLLILTQILYIYFMYKAKGG